MRIGDASFGADVTIRASAHAVDAVVATARLDSVEVAGPVRAHRSGRGVTLMFPIRYPAKHNCVATVTTTVAIWNGGSLLEGGGALDGPCAEQGHQAAAFVFRRKR
jgi:hypothetical protein